MPGASGTTINLVVSGVAARAVLWPDFAPKSVALVQSLPHEPPLQHCKRSGPACFAELAGGAISTIEGLETPVISIHPGVLALRPPHPGLPSGELLLTYGDAQFRMPDGRRFVTPLGEIEPGSDTVLAGTRLHRRRGMRDASVEGCRGRLMALAIRTRIRSQ